MRDELKLDNLAIEPEVKRQEEEASLTFVSNSSGKGS